MTVVNIHAAKINSIHAAELRIIRALRLIAITLSDAMDDMCWITHEYDSPTPPQAPEVSEAAENSWSNVARLLRLIRGTISNIHGGNGPAFDGHPDIVDDCEAAIKAWDAEWAEPQRLARDQRLLEKRREQERKLGLGKGPTA